MIDNRPETGFETAGSPIRLHRQLNAIWGSGQGLQRLSAVNHTIVGIRFMVTALVFFAIGGIEPGNLAAVQAAGAQRVAVVRAITAASDPAAASRQLLDLLQAA